MKLIDFLNSPWAIMPDRLIEIQLIYTTHFRGEKIDIQAIEARLGRPLANDQKEYNVENGVGVLSISGVITNKANLFSPSTRRAVRFLASRRLAKQSGRWLARSRPFRAAPAKCAALATGLDRLRMRSMSAV